MTTLADTSLSEQERRVLERLALLLEEAYGPDLEAVWLYGSRARGEPRREESDVDVLVIVSGGDEAELRRRVFDLKYEAAKAEDAEAAFFSVVVATPEWLAGRREIDAFFILEVDRDKVVLFGER